VRNLVKNEELTHKNKKISYTPLDSGFAINKSFQELKKQLGFINTFLDFYENNGAKYFEASFYGTLKQGNTLYHRILNKSVIVPNPKINPKDLSQIYCLKSEFNNSFLKQFVKEYWLTAEITLFNAQGEKLLEFSCSEDEFIIYNYSNQQLIELKGLLEIFEKDFE